jgi:hypothetical protein
MSTVQIKDRFLALRYAETYAQWAEGQRLGLQQLADQRAFPSTDKNSTEGERGPCSPLGGKVW